VSPSTARGPAASRSPPHLAHQGRPAPAQQREKGATATPPARSSRAASRFPRLGQERRMHARRGEAGPSPRVR
jgi:hypothetical protein